MEGFSFPRQDPHRDPQAEQKQNVRDVATQYAALLIIDIIIPIVYVYLSFFFVSSYRDRKSVV